MLISSVIQIRLLEYLNHATLVDMLYSTHLIGGQVHAQVCHLFSRAHPASFLPRHEVFICLRCGRETQMSSTSGIQTQCFCF